MSKSDNAITRRDFLKILGAASLIALSERQIALPQQSQSLKSPPPPNILVLVFDALTAKDMSLYGYTRATTPNFEKFAGGATVYHRHYSTGSFTTPGTASLLTGVLPWTHRAINLQGTVISQYIDQNIFSLLPADYRTFAYTHNSLAYVLLDQFTANLEDLLKISDLALYSDIWTDLLPLNEFQAPFESELLSVKNSSSTNSSMILSLIDEAQRTYRSKKLIQEYRKEFPRGLPNCRSESQYNSLCFTLETAIDWIVEQFKPSDRPFLGYVHLFPPHAPYNPRKEFIGRFKDSLDHVAKPEHFFSAGEDPKSLARLRQRYDENIAYVDAEFGRMIELLDRANSLENTCLIVTSDHGEIFERGISGHNTEVLYEPLIQIPLLIAYPGQKNRVDIYSHTSSIDILPTVLQQSGAHPIPGIEGEILPRITADPPSRNNIIAVEAKSSPSRGKLNKATFALIQDRYKIIHYRGYQGYEDQYELYDLEADPEETTDLHNSQPEIAEEMTRTLNESIAPYI